MRPQFWEEHGFTSDNDLRFREICQQYPDDVLMQRPHEIFAPPRPPDPPPERPGLPAQYYDITPMPIRVNISATTNTTASLFDDAEPDNEEHQATKDEPKQPSHCEICGSSVDDLGDVLQLEAPEAYLVKNLSDKSAPCLKFWHRKCFEAHYKLRLPEFPMSDIAPEPRPISRRILIKDNPQGAQHDVR